MSKLLCISLLCTFAALFGACGDEEMSSAAAPVNAAAQDKTQVGKDSKVSQAAPKPADAVDADAPAIINDPIPPVADPLPLPPPPLLPYPDGPFLGGGGGGGRHERDTPPKASLALVKTASATTLVENAVITYSFTLTNDGELPLSAVTINDPLPGLSSLTCTPSLPLETLAADAEVSCTATYTVTAEDVADGTLSNTATASGINDDDETVTASATVVIGGEERGLARDFSDARASYGAPSHVVAEPSVLRLGTLIDTESASLPSSDVNGDDNSGSDDEDAVGAIAVISGAETTVPVQVFNNSGANATLVGWIDFDNNGSFDNPSERVATQAVSTGGLATVNLVFPAATISNDARSAARFRLFPGDAVANPNPSPIGDAGAGEVEDHTASLTASVENFDFSDAPVSYGSPSHLIPATPVLRLGTLVDTELASLPSAIANGDDLAGDDEDAVGAITVVSGAATTIAVQVFNNTGANATLVGWIDFDSSGSFDNPGERVIATAASTGAIATVNLEFPAVTIATASTSFARFRLFAGGVDLNPNPSPTAAATAGEVEDHTAVLNVATDGLDFSDAPALYGAPSHTVAATPTLRLGALIDQEIAALPSIDADQDDLDVSDDEDGIGTIMVISDTATNVPVAVFNNTGASATLVGWIDFDNNGSFDNLTERVTTQVSSTGSIDTVNLVFPATTITAFGGSYARFRLFAGDANVNPDPSPTAVGGAGEVEDYVVDLVGLDFGDAPESEAGDPPIDLYNTLLENDGPRHAVPDYDAQSDTALLMLGASIDLEADGVPSAGAVGDDEAGITPSDEDGLANGPIVFTTSGGASVSINVENGTDDAAHLVGWIDVNDNGIFENTAQERVIASVAAQTTATVPLTFAATAVVSGTTMARFRLFPGAAPSPPTASNPSPDGFASAGEVEDYPVTLNNDVLRH